MPLSAGEERVKAHRAKKCAQMTMVDAFEIVKTGHTGSKVNFLKNAAVISVHTLSTTDKASIGIGLTISAGVVIAGLATGGLAIPVLIGLGASSWAINKAIIAIGADLSRNNRNWLQRFPNAKSSAAKETATFLNCEAGDAIRRAIDHYRMMTNEIIPKELKPQDQSQYDTCEDAINHVKAVARFIHHGDKVRNYTLPVLDMLIFYLEQYDELAKAWIPWESAFRTAMIKWFSGHSAKSCAATNNDVCYAPNGNVGTFPWQPHTSGKSNWLLPVDDDVPAPPGAIEIRELIAAMKKAREKVISGMHVSSTTTWNYSAERPATFRVLRGANDAHPEQKLRLDAKTDSVWN